MIFALLCAMTIAATFEPAQEPAQTATADQRPPLAESLGGEAREAYLTGNLLFDSQDWTRAMAKYSQAYDQARDPRLLYNMALCARGTRDYARTWSLLARFEREEGTHLGADVRADVDAAMVLLKQIIGQVDLDVSEAGAAVTLDGQLVGVTPLASPLAVNPGKHAIAVAKDGFVPDERRIEITGGTRSRIAIALAPRAVDLDPEGVKAGPNRNALAAPPQAEASALGTRPARTWRKPAGWSLVAVATGAVVLAAAFGVESLSDVRSSRSMCPDNWCTAQGYQENRAARMEANVVDVAVAGAVAAAGCGLYLLLTSRPRAPDRSPPMGAAATTAGSRIGFVTVAASPTPGGVSVSLDGRW
jgi:hypothetical protein